MPPSPSLRRSPSLEPRDDVHKRGRSLESGLSFKERDDDLTLFNELQSRERETFLLQSTDDFEDIFSSKGKPFPELKLGINIPVRGESSDLLNADGDKNDYEWLITPPETPLFSSLDDEPPPVNLVYSGRPRSRPISISRSSTMEKSERSIRGSPSPQRMSLSPRSGTSTFRGRPSSAPQTSPIALRGSPPSRRPSPPPMKPSTPPRSLTPTSRRPTPKSSGNVSTSSIRGTSPSRGTSASPKVKAWQSNLPGFSLEAPPNLRTSLADRPASYVRGSSPASRTSRGGRQSMSPTATRSVGSSHSQERDRLSSHSRGSFASSGDDDTDSLQSAPLSVSDRPMSRKGVGGYSSGRPSAYSKKPMKTFSPSSAPKRSFDSAMRQMDRRSPQNMFRPLLSSVPSSTFYAGKVISDHRPLTSRNSSVTTSSNGSSNLAISGAHDTEDDVTSEYVRAPYTDIQDEVFAFEKPDIANEHTGLEGHEPFSNPIDSKESGLHICATEVVASVLDDGFAKINGRENLLLCSICGTEYYSDEFAVNENNICPQCKQNEEFLSQNITAPLTNTFDESHVTESTLASGNTDSKEISQTALHEENNNNNTLEVEDQVSQLRESCLESSLSISTKEEITGEHTTVNDQEMPKSYDNKPNRNINISEGAGISVLLNRSSSFKGHLVHGRTINSSAISYDDLSYTRDLTSSMRSSTTSSLDLTTARHGEMVVQRQMSGKRSDVSSKHRSTGSSFSGTSTSLQVYQGFGLSMSSHDGSCEGSVSNLRHIVGGELLGSPSDHIELHDAATPSVSRAAFGGEDNNGVCTSSGEKDASFVVDNVVCSDFEDKSRACVGPDEGNVVHEFEENRPASLGNIENLEQTAFVESSMVEESIVQERVDEGGAMEESVLCSESTMSEIEINDSHPSSPKSQIDAIREEFEDPSTIVNYDEDVQKSSLKTTETSYADEIAEESMVTVEEPQGRRTRSLTLEEATDTILFCNSIIHDLAYKAASIAIEKEKENLEPLEGSRPMVTIPDKRSSVWKIPDPIPRGRSPKTHKIRKRWVSSETELKPPLTENEDRSDEPVVRNVGIPNHGDSMRPPKLESKCNCTIM